MKKLLFAAVFSLFCISTYAQVKRYVLLEHFTNSRCSICASKNPAFYTLIGGYTQDIHHIAYHPPIPYNNCFFYLANTTENTGRTNFYGVNATPRIALNGSLVPVSSQLLPTATLTAAIPATSPIHLQVTETSGADRTATVQVFSDGAVPEGNYTLYLAVVEKTVNYNAPNGEAVHHDVFRTMLPGINGSPITLAPQGSSVTVNFPYTVNAAWVANEVYVVAFVQNNATKEVLNSGTRFDPLVVSTSAPVVQAVSIQPNPVTDAAIAYIGEDRAESLEVFGMNGQRMVTTFDNQQIGAVSFSLHGLPKGIYVVKITGKEKVYTSKVVKE